MFSSRSSTAGTTSGCSRWARSDGWRRSWRSASPRRPAISIGSSRGTRSAVRDRDREVPRRRRGAAPAAGRLLRPAREGELQAADAIAASRGSGFPRDPRSSWCSRSRAAFPRRSRTPPPTGCRAPAAGSYLAAASGASPCWRPARPSPDLGAARQGARREGGRRAAGRRRDPGGPGRGRPEPARGAATPSRSAASRAGSSAGFEDLGTYRLLLSMTDPDALRAFADAMLGAARRLRPRPQRGADRLAPGVPPAQRPLGDGRRPALRASPHPPLPDAQGRGAHRPGPRRAASTGWSSGWRCAPATSWPPSPTPDRPVVPAVQRPVPRGPSGEWPVRRFAAYWRSDLRFIRSDRSEPSRRGAWPTATRCSSTANG